MKKSNVALTIKNRQTNCNPELKMKRIKLILSKNTNLGHNLIQQKRGSVAQNTPQQS